MVWQTSDVGRFMDEKYVNLRIITSEPEYPQYRKDFNVPGTPTILFLDAKGEEIDRIVGFDGEKDPFFQTLKDFAVGKNTLPAILADLENNPDDVDLNYKLAKKYLDRYELDKAQPCFEKVLKLDPEDQKGYKTEATYNIAIQEAQSKQNAEPLKAFIASGPDEKYLYMSYSTLARHYQRKRDNDNVIATFEEALSKMPDNARMTLAYASAIFNGQIENQYDKGLDLNKKAIELDPELELASYFNLFQYYQNIKDTDTLIATFEEALQKWPDHQGIANYYATTIFRRKIQSKYDRGIELMEKVIEEDADSAYLWNTLAQLYHLKGDSEKAITAIKKALEINPENKAYQNSLEKFEK